MTRLFYLLAGCLTTNAHAADLYKWQDAQGLWHYTDATSSHAQILQPAPTVTAADQAAAQQRGKDLQTYNTQKDRENAAQAREQKKVQIAAENRLRKHEKARSSTSRYQPNQR